MNGYRMLFHRRAFLRAMSVLAATPVLRAAGWNVTQQAPKERKGYEMEIKRVGSQPSAKGPSDWFTAGTDRSVISGARSRPGSGCQRYV